MMAWRPFRSHITNVDAAAGNPVANDWFVLAGGDIFDQYAGYTGDVSAQTETTTIPLVPLDPSLLVALNIDDTAFLSLHSFGSATNGVAESWALTDLVIGVLNQSGQALTFSFAWEASADAAVSGFVPNGDDAYAYAEVLMLDELGFVDIYALAEADLLFLPLSDAMLDNGTFTFSLADGEENFMLGYIDSIGLAAAVPEPDILVLLSTGLIAAGIK